MKYKTIALKQWDELSPEEQRKTLVRHYDINVMHNWWDFIYEDAADVGVTIQEFSLNARYSIRIKFEQPNPLTVARDILRKHGSETATHFAATAFVNRVNRTKADKVFTVIQKRDEIEDAENIFKREIEKAYWLMLSRDYEHLTSEAQVIETIKSMGYYFDSEGRILEPDPEPVKG